MRSDLTMVGMPEEGTAVGESDRVLSLLQGHVLEVNRVHFIPRPACAFSCCPEKVVQLTKIIITWPAWA